jgi:ElaB/YqjD/DUF883 family membrane-anchored ribosome-binding protein
MTNESSARQGTGQSAGSSQAHATTDQLASRMHETVDRVADTARTAEKHIRARAAELGDQARETEERALEVLEANLQKARTYVEENPLLSAGIAFAAGVVLSGLLTRR